MNRLILKLLPHLRQQHLQLFRPPPQPTLLLRPRKDRQTQRLQRRRPVLVVPHPDLLVLCVTWPAVGRPLLLYDGDVDEAGVGEPFAILEGGAHAVAVGGEAVLEEVGPFVQGVVGVESVVVGVEGIDDVHELGVAARFEVAGSGQCLNDEANSDDMWKVKYS